eukprot:gene2210-4298_t
MQHCQKGRELLLDLQRSEWLPQFDDDGVRAVINEMSELWDLIISIMSNEAIDDISDSLKVSLVYYHQCLYRDRRYMYAFFQHRMSRVRRLRWETGPVLPENIRPILSDRENDYFMEYNTLLSDYCKSIGNIELTSDLEPPKELYIEIRVIRDCGEIMTDLGPVHLDAGTIHFLRRSDVETLIRQGLVEHFQSDQN